MLLLANLLILQACGFCLWLRSRKTRNVNIVDIFWGTGFAIVAAVTATGIALGWWPSQDEIVVDAASKILSDSQLVLVAMVVVWGTRLSTYLAIRSWGKSEDHRYAAMRNYWGTRFPVRSLFTVFGLQAFLIWFISLPVQLGIWGEPCQPWALVLGAVLWLIGFSFESISDWQMYRFKQDAANRGQVMNRGLWRYTRHPNYFGDFMVWWGVFLVAAQPGSWWWTILAPGLMSFLLLRVSGVTLLESSLKQRIAGYEQYVKNTSSFFPKPPKRDTQ
jgi:steroid 5-alpha reductase family enzyme